MQKYKSNITTTSGAAVRGVPVLVIKEDGSNAALFLDRAGTAPAPNPLTTGPDGVFYFYAVNGRYSLRTTVEGVTITDDDVVLMMDPEEITVTGPIAEAVAQAQAAATAAELVVANSGIPGLVAAAQNAVVDANNAVSLSATSANNAALSKTGADIARDAAVIAKNAAEAALDSFDDRYLGAKAVAPTTDNDGGALLPGAMYWDTVLGAMRAWSGSVWVTLPAATKASVGLANVDNTSDAAKIVASAGKLTTARTINGVSFDGSANISIDAAAVPNTPAGSIAATTVQGAINELAEIKVDLAAATGASLVGFPGEPGWTLKQQLDMLFYGAANVTDPRFAGGAKDDGSDATAAIQAAIDSLPSGGVVHGAGKTFTVKTLLLKSDMTLMNMRLVTKSGAENMVSPITIDGRTTKKTNIRVLNVVVDGNRKNQTSITASDEDGGRHGFRLVGDMAEILISDCGAYNCGTDGIEIFSDTSVGPTDAKFVFSRITLRNFIGNGNRRHGMSADSIADSVLINCEFSGNGLDLNTTDAGTHGNRGARVSMSLANPLYGNGIDFEGYGLGSSIDTLKMQNVTALGNARSGVLFYDPSVLTAPGFSRRRKIWISDSYFDAGVDPSRSGAALELTSTVSAEGTGILYDGVYVTNTRLDGALYTRCVNNLRFDGDIVYSGGADVHFARVIHSTNIHLGAGTVGGASRSINAISSTYTVGPETLPFPAAPTLSKFGGSEGTLSGPIVSQVARMGGRTFRFFITATWTASATGVPVFAITPAAGSAIQTPPSVVLLREADAIAVPAGYLMSLSNFRFSDPNTGAITMQITVDVSV